MEKMRKFSESTGHKDQDGNWVDETPQAKLRNQLGPFWNLVSILSEERLDKLLNHPDGLEMIQKCLEQCKDSLINKHFYCFLFQKKLRLDFQLQFRTKNT